MRTFLPPGKESPIQSTSVERWNRGRESEGKGGERHDLRGTQGRDGKMSPWKIRGCGSRDSGSGKFKDAPDIGGKG